MALVVGIPKEKGKGEERIAIVPEVCKKFRSLGSGICMERGAGSGSHYRDTDFEGAEIVGDPAEVYARSGVVLKVQPPSPDEIRLARDGTVMIGFFRPFESAERARVLCERRVTSFAVELIPRISRAQPMDVLSSQATVAGYVSALIAADNCPKFFPMITYAAGTLRPARVLVIGVGVAGLQAIATAHRLGAIVEAYDVRPETREQAESVGARFVDTGVSAAGEGGYARELTPEEKKLQADRLAKALSAVDVLITTAAVPGKKSPLIVTGEMISGMKPGALIVDMAAEGGGNVAGTIPGEIVHKENVTILGPINLPSRMPVHASEMYSKNLFNFVSPFIKDGELALDWTDEIIAGSIFTRDGQIPNEAIKTALGL